MQVETGRARLQPVRQIHVRSPRSKSPPCLSSSGTATARSHTKVSYNEPKMTVMRAPPRQRTLQQRALTHGGNTLTYASFQPRVRALDLSNAGGDAKEQCEPVSNPFARSMCNDQRSQSSPCLSNSGTETARSYGREEHNQPIKYLWADSANSVLSFITSYETMLADYKAHRRPPRPPPRRKAGRASSPLSGGKEPQGGLPNPESGRWIWWEKKKIRTHPSSCLPPDPSAIPTSAASAPPCSPRNGPAPRGMQVKALYSKNAYESEHAVSFFFFLHGQSAPSRADSACSALKQTTHRLCVSPAEKAFRLQGGTHSL